MKTFESVYKEILKEQLADFFPEKPILVSNDISYKPLEKDANTLLAVIRTGAGENPSISSYDLVKQPFTIQFIVNSNDTQEVLGGLNSLIANYNGKWDTLKLPYFIITKEIHSAPIPPEPGEEEEESEEEVLKMGTLTEVDVSYKPVFTKPFVVGSPISLQTKNETINVSIIFLSITVNYTTNTEVILPEYKLTIGSTEYDLKGIIRTSHTSMPTYDPDLALGEKITKQDLTTNNVVFNFVMVKILNNDLHEILSKDFYQATSGMVNAGAVKLKKDNEEIVIQTVQITETREGGMTLISLVLGR